MYNPHDFRFRIRHRVASKLAGSNVKKCHHARTMGSLGVVCKWFPVLFKFSCDVAIQKGEL